MTNIEEILINEGPMLSGTLLDRLSDDWKELSPEAARKKLERLESPIHKLRGFFQNNQSFVYHQKQYNSIIYYERLVESIKQASSQCYVLLVAIKYHGGYVKKSEIASYSFNTVEALKGHKLTEIVIEDLLRYNILRQDEEYYALNPLIYPASIINYSKGISLVKDITLNQFNSWARGINLISYESGTFYSEFFKLQWGFVAPSYIASISTKTTSETTPGFVVADILINEHVTVDEISFFIKKIQIVKAQKKLPKVIPFLLVNTLSQEALNLLKQHGIIIGFIDKLFGVEYANLLKSILSMLTNAGSILKSNPDQFIKMIEQIRKLVDNKTNNLRGDLFELAVGYYYSNICQQLEIGKKIISNDKHIELDVVAIFHNEIAIAECKGYKSKISKEIIEDWLTSKIPYIYLWINNHSLYRSKNVVFEFWSTGGFTSEAIEFFNNRTSTLKKYKVLLLDQEAMVKRAQENNLNKFVQVMREYYLKESI